MKNLNSVARRLEYARKLAGLTRRGLSVRAGLDPTHVRLIEDVRSDGEPRLKTVQKLAAALGVPVMWLLAGEGPAPTREDIQAASKAAA